MSEWKHGEIRFHAYEDKSSFLQQIDGENHTETIYFEEGELPRLIALLQTKLDEKMNNEEV